MVSVLGSGSSGPGSSPKTLNSQSYSDFNAWVGGGGGGGTLRWTSIPSRG